MKERRKRGYSLSDYYTFLSKAEGEFFIEMPIVFAQTRLSDGEANYVRNRVQRLKNVLEKNHIDVHIQSSETLYLEALKITRHKNSPESLPPFKVMRETGA